METTSREVWKYINRLISANSLRNRHHFINNCIKEKVIPKSAQYILKNSHQIFPTYVQDYLLSIAKELKLQEIETFEEARKIKLSLLTNNLLLPHDENYIAQKIASNNRTQSHKLEKKLNFLCTNSKWKNVGRKDLILNLSDTPLNTTEEEALSLGLKFATGQPKYDITDIISSNYKHTDSNLQKGFIQGIIAASTITHNTNPTIPRRYTTALQNLANNKNLIITSADKGGGIVIMNTNTYDEKMFELLNDTNTYLPTDAKTIQKAVTDFNRSYKRIIGKHKDTWLSIIEYHPRMPKIYGLPKTHKKDIPMRPIVSSVDSAPHRIAKAIAKILTPFLGTISPSHLRNSGDLLNKIKHLNLHNMTLSSLDIKSLYTNIPVRKCIDKLKSHFLNSNLNLPLPIDKIFQICTLCTNLCYFEFKGQFYKQISGLPMGSPLSGVLACLYLEILESGPFQQILPQNSYYFRYIDDTLLIHDKHLVIPTLISKLNSVEPSINFTYETESNHTLPFLDIKIHNTDTYPLFDVFRKPTDTSDYINFHSHHDNRIKTGMIIGFYLRAYRICSPCYIKAEEDKLFHILTTLQYPKYFILNARKKALKIHHTAKNTNINSNINKSSNQHIILPFSPLIPTIRKNIRKLGLNITTSGSKTIKDIVGRNTKSSIPTEAGIYSIKCHICKKTYVGETSRNIQIRLSEHKRAIKHGNLDNAMVIHMSDTGHDFDLEGAKMLKYAHNKRRRKMLEAAIISNSHVIEQRAGFYTISEHLAKAMVRGIT